MGLINLLEVAQKVINNYKIDDYAIRLKINIKLFFWKLGQESSIITL